jgi:hypothetical protein
MEAICSSETSVDFQRTTRRYIPEDGTLHNHHCENLKTYTRLHGVTSQKIVLFIVTIVETSDPLCTYICESVMILKKTDFEMLMYLHVFCPHDYEKVVFGILSVHLFVCVHGCRDVSLAIARMHDWILFIFDIQGCIHPRLVPSEYRQSSFKNMGPSDRPQNT